MPENRPPVVAIIGGGFSGVMTAVHLARQGKPVHILLINQKYPLAKGVAYSAPADIFLLNVRAGRMSAFASEPDHFVNWLSRLPDFEDQELHHLKDLYVSRKLYGRYLNDIYDKARQSLPPGVHLTVLDAEASGVTITEEGTYIISFRDHAPGQADFLVLALGNFEPAPLHLQHPESLTDHRYIHNPWKPEALEGVKPTDNLLLVGTGLTMIDIVLWLRSRNHSGTIYALSPKGLLPLPYKHSPLPVPHLENELKEPYDLLSLFKVFRKYLKNRAGEDLNWTTLIEALRPKTQNIWQKLSTDDKKRFIRHLASAWSVSRHRIPVQVHEQLKQSLDSGQMKLLSARLVDLHSTSDNLTATIRRRGRPETEQLPVQWVINCTGPQGNYVQLQHPLVQSLLAEGLITPDPLSLGINATEKGLVIGKNKKPYGTLLTLGPPLRGILWESTAVNEIRGQAEALGVYLAEKL